MGKGLKRWAPLLGTTVLVGVVGLRGFGYHEAAATLEGVGAATGVASQSPISVTEGAAILSSIGLLIKYGTLLVGVVRRALAPEAPSGPEGG